MDALKPGAASSEFKLTAAALVFGAVLEGVAGVLEQLGATGHGASWFPVALAICGMLLQVCALFGYVKGRAVVKAAAIALAPPQTPPAG